MVKLAKLIFYSVLQAAGFDFAHMIYTHFAKSASDRPDCQPLVANRVSHSSGKYIRSLSYVPCLNHFMTYHLCLSFRRQTSSLRICPLAASVPLPIDHARPNHATPSCLCHFSLDLPLGITEDISSRRRYSIRWKSANAETEILSW